MAKSKDRTFDPGGISVMVHPSKIYITLCSLLSTDLTYVGFYNVKVCLCKEKIIFAQYLFPRAFFQRQIFPVKGPKSVFLYDGGFLPGLDTLFDFSCERKRKRERESLLSVSCCSRVVLGSPRNLNVTHGCARGFTLHVSPVPCLAHINIPVSLSHE